MNRFLKKKVLRLLTAGVFLIALSASSVLLTGCPEEPDPIMDPPREDPPEEPEDGEELPDPDFDDFLDMPEQ